MDAEQLLQEEYRQLCSDWRARDQYMQTKLSGSAFAFAILAWAAKDVVTSESATVLWLGVGVSLLAALYALVMYVSAAKDGLYRRGTESAMKLILGKLEGPGARQAGAVTQVLADAETFESLGTRTTRQLLLTETSWLMMLPKRLPTTLLIRLFYLLVAGGFAYLGIHLRLLALTMQAAQSATK